MTTNNWTQKTIDLLRAADPILEGAYIAGCQSGNQTAEEREEGFKEWVKSFYNTLEEVWGEQTK